MMSAAQNASKTLWKVRVMDSTGKTEDTRAAVLEDNTSTVAKLQKSVEGLVNKKRAKEEKGPISLDMRMNFGGDLYEVDDEEILLELVPSPNESPNGFIATIKPNSAGDDGSNANDHEDSRRSKKPRKSDATRAGTQWQTIAANGGADEAVTRAEKVLLVAVTANETGGDEAKIFADKLLRTHAGHAKSALSKNKAETTARAIEKKLVDMVKVEGANIRVNRKKFRGIFRTKTHRQGYDCFTRFLLGKHYVENENGSKDCDAIDGDTTESCILELVERTKEPGRKSGSLKYFVVSLDTLAFTRVP